MRNLMRQSVVALVYAISLIGTLAHAQTNRQEVTIGVSSSVETRARLIKVMIDDGFLLQSESTSVLVFTKAFSAAKGVLYQALLGNPNNTSPQYEVTYNLVSMPDNIRIVASGAVVMQNAFGQIQRNSNITKQDATYLASLLDNLKGAVEGTITNPDEAHGANAPKPLFSYAGSDFLEPKTVRPRVIRGFVEWDNYTKTNPKALVSVGGFFDTIKPRNEKDCAERILTQAAEIGADIVVILPTAKDVRASDPSQPTTMKYGAVAYAIAKARLGILWDRSMVAKGKFVVKSIAPEAIETTRELQIGDEVIALADIPLSDRRSSIAMLRREPGDQVKVTIIRNGKREEIVVQAIAQ